MYEIRKAEESIFEGLRAFLEEVPSIDEIDEEVLKNASVLYLDGKVYGMISYEAFFNYALVRYFVFKRTVDQMVIKELFESIEESVSKNHIEYIFSLVNQNDIFDLFSSLNFYEVNKEDVFVEEQGFAKTKFKDTRLMIKKVNEN